MLVLTRKRSQSINVTVPPSSEPTLVTVTIVASGSSHSRIGVHAPRSTHIVRSELVESLQPGKAA